MLKVDTCSHLTLLLPGDIARPLIDHPYKYYIPDREEESFSERVTTKTDLERS
jgi:hypothetical protein